MRRKRGNPSFSSGSYHSKPNSRKIQRPSDKWKKRRESSKTHIACKFFEFLIFISCLALLIYQSASFLMVYYSYPTTVNVAFTHPEKFKMPAVTFCNDNPIRRGKFCEQYQDLCGRPEDMQNFCTRFPILCKGEIPNFVFPKAWELSTDELAKNFEAIYKAVLQFYNNTDFNKIGWNDWTVNIKTTNGTMRPIFVVRHIVPNLPVTVTCYSKNLRINDRSESDEYPFTTQGKYIDSYEINIKHTDGIVPYHPPRIFMSIHSPFVPVHPFTVGKILKQGRKYSIYMRLEEDVLLPYPYQTDCTDYESLWRSNNTSGYRSQEMCREMCETSTIITEKDDTRMFEFPPTMCVEMFLNCHPPSTDKEFEGSCKRNCGRSCRSLQYKYTIIESSLKTLEDSLLGQNREEIVVELFVADRQVMVISHLPLYEMGHLFSYIGGLMGYWLGISVWTLAGMVENGFQRVTSCMPKIRRHFKRLTLFKNPLSSSAKRISTLRRL